MLFYKNHLVKYCIPARTQLFLELQEEYIRNAVLCLVTQFCPTLCHPMDYRPPGSFVYGQEYWSGLPCSPSGDLPDPGIKPRSPSLQVDSLPTEPSGKPKNTGVGSHSCHQVFFPTQESNWGLLHCRWILYQLRYQGSPCKDYHPAENPVHAYGCVLSQPLMKDKGEILIHIVSNNHDYFETVYC